MSKQKRKMKIKTEIVEAGRDGMGIEGIWIASTKGKLVKK